jgi:hypothetical protein
LTQRRETAYDHDIDLMLVVAWYRMDVTGQEKINART